MHVEVERRGEEVGVVDREVEEVGVDEGCEEQDDTDGPFHIPEVAVQGASEKDVEFAVGRIPKGKGEKHIKIESKMMNMNGFMKMGWNDIKNYNLLILYPMSEPLILGYWHIRGRGQPIRHLLAYSGLKF